ncbi:MAG: SUMF1/EgtB/PvdO family nonheme iron enzyme, partial [Roseiflexus sp.]|nr:SUMF1/EgtB/PvdO family nonheme iron enzyme [Roseiflexus sp.]
SELEGEMSRFLRRLQCDRIEERLEAFEQALRDETGLLLAVGEDTYAFPHLSFQEYLAACALADDPEMGRRAYGYWNSADGDRWREVLLLLVGRLRQQGKIESQGVAWLRILLHPEEPLATPALDHAQASKRTLKPINQQARDALLAADSYQEWGGRAALAGFEEEEIRQLEARIARRLAKSLHPESRLSLGERLRIGRHLGQLGDPRFPVTRDEWRASLADRNATFGAPEGYWCYVPGGRYRIGGWERGEKSADLDLRPFWIARYPITIAQYRAFIEEGGYARDEYWTPRGRAWRDEWKRTQPWRWDDPQYTGANQPVVGIMWYEATSFCAWLQEQVQPVGAQRAAPVRDAPGHAAPSNHALLPEGYTIRLPTEAEWEVAAAYGGDGRRRAYPWGNDGPTPERAIYKESGLSAPAPVGVCPAGAAVCGALDMAGNVWEVTTSLYRKYPSGSSQLMKDFAPDKSDVPWRGGSYFWNRIYVRCGARDRSHPNVGRLSLDGFRIVVAPHSH